MSKKELVSEDISIASSSNEDNDEENDRHVASDSSCEANESYMDIYVKNKLKQIKDKARKRVKVDIAKEKLLKRKTRTSSKSIEKVYPDIGKVMESFAESCDIGADKWRRTGVYTFSGDPKKEKRLTFKWLQKTNVTLWTPL